MATKKQLRKALERSVTALDDWVHTYASEFCDKGKVELAYQRIRNGGGTLMYISTIQQKNREALK